MKGCKVPFGVLVLGCAPVFFLWFAWGFFVFFDGRVGFFCFFFLVCVSSSTIRSEASCSPSLDTVFARFFFSSRRASFVSEIILVLDALSDQSWIFLRLRGRSLLPLFSSFRVHTCSPSRLQVYMHTRYKSTEENLSEFLYRTGDPGCD